MTVSQDYDQTNPEHAVLLCKALGFVNVPLHEGSPPYCAVTCPTCHPASE